MKYTLRIVLLICLCTLSFERGHAQSQTSAAPSLSTVSYQGYIVDNTGRPLTGQHAITVALYAAEQETSPIWQDTFDASVVNGVFSLQLGAGKSLPAPAQMDRPLWVGFALDGGSEYTARTAISGVPYALNVADNSVTAAKIAPNAITADKLNVDYVSGITVNGERITGKGTALNLVGGDGVGIDYDRSSGIVVLHSSGSGGSGISKGEKTQSHVGGSAVDYWGEQGNQNITVPTQFIGTTDTSRAFEIHLKENTVTAPLNRVFHTEIQTSQISPDFVFGFGAGASTGNTVSGHGSTIGGGGALGKVNAVSANFSFIGSGTSNTVSADTSSVLGGSANSILSGANGTVIAGGSGQTVTEGASYAGIGSGAGNTVHNYLSFVGGGLDNTIGDPADLDGDDSSNVIAGGSHNYISEGWGTIGGGGYNGILGSANYGSILGGEFNAVNGAFGSIGGGMNNSIELGADASVIAGGKSNTVFTQNGFVGGGTRNKVKGKFASIVAGDTNRIGMDPHAANGVEGAAIGGGEENVIDGDEADFSVIAGGKRNVISGAADTAATIGGGWANQVLGSATGTDNSAYSVVAGGRENIISKQSPAFVIAGGRENDIDVQAPFSVIGGGHLNYAATAFSTIAGGESNRIDLVSPFGFGYPSDHSFIGGGGNNLVQSHYDFLGGGLNNILDVDTFESGYNVLGGGESNYVSYGCHHNVLGGGLDNQLGSACGVIAGGQNNSIEGPSIWNSISGGYLNYIGWTSERAYTEYNAIGGGSSNSILSSWYSTIAGGDSNSISSYYSTIGGGVRNNVDATSLHATIGGGDSNTITFNSSWSTIGGGFGNLIADAIRLDKAEYNTIAGGELNVNHGNVSSIGGGRFNRILDVSVAATIPGGDSLIATGYGQTVVGFLNRSPNGIPRDTSYAGHDEPLFIVGNGVSSKQRTNAFEVSYNGHSTVFDVNLNTSGGGRTPFRGARYVDNTIVAWGDIPGTGGGFITPVADFGVRQVQHPWPGVYVVTMSLKDIDGIAVSLQRASITATLIDDTSPEGPGGSCGTITVSHIGTYMGLANSFVVRTYPGGSGAPACATNDMPFYFKVVGR